MALGSDRAALVHLLDSFQETLETVCSQHRDGMEGYINIPSSIPAKNGKIQATVILGIEDSSQT